MKKTGIIILSVLTAVFLTACAGERGIKAGSATGEALAHLLPATTQGLVVIDVGRAAATTAAAKSLEDEQARQTYEGFIEAVGIDPMKDIFFVVMGLTGAIDAEDQDGAVIVNLRYEKEPILGLIKENAEEFMEESYLGMTLYKARADGRTDRVMAGAFLDDSNILVGTETAVKAVIDVHQKKADSLARNEALMRTLKTVNKSAIAWGAFSVPPGLIDTAIEENPMLKALEGITALTMSFDYKNRNLLVDMRTMGGTKEQNANLASTLNGLKGLGAMMAAQEPALGEALAGIEITSGADYVRIYATLPEQVMQTLQKQAQTSLGDIIPSKKAPSEDDEI